jgi:hypothetical protein
MNYGSAPNTAGVPVWNTNVPMSALKAAVGDKAGTYSLSAKTPTSTAPIVTKITLTP